MYHCDVTFNIDLTPPTSGPVTVEIKGSVDYAGPHPSQILPQLGPTLQGAIQSVLQAKLNGHQVAMPTLSQSLPHFVPEIMQSAAGPLAASQITLQQLNLTANVPQHAVAPAAGQVMSGSEIAANVAGNFAQNAVASAIPTSVSANVGGVRLRVGAGEPSLGDQVADRAADEIKSRILHYAIIGGVLVLVSGICVVAIAIKLIF